MDWGEVAVGVGWLDCRGRWSLDCGMLDKNRFWSEADGESEEEKVLWRTLPQSQRV